MSEDGKNKMNRYASAQWVKGITKPTSIFTWHILVPQTSDNHETYSSGLTRFPSTSCLLIYSILHIMPQHPLACIPLYLSSSLTLPHQEYTAWVYLISSDIRVSDHLITPEWLMGAINPNQLSYVNLKLWATSSVCYIVIFKYCITWESILTNIYRNKQVMREVQERLLNPQEHGPILP